ncbi:hypothetical protein OO013_16675 [Mangrovivirga sp. M17]|uniref:Lipocalin-like domain-containing protein n=1 Tax=Mangrovivirga halotolerans TaxID=2993936 RepID=A0ABT3RUR3_9BACT|nr:hypothetical protein [Mangrovivirga halotolerans]MCX2745517.1 hypothetical protein [Mangrovivirga halotolerans]
MRNFLIITFLFILGLVGCDNNPTPTPTVADFKIEGQWNLIKYTDLNGTVSDKTYTISYWYEQGLEFTSNNEYYPRYDPKLRFDTEEWQSDYKVGPGSYTISNDTLILSYKEYNYKYSLRIKDPNTFEISNTDASITPLTGTWTLGRSK